MKRKYLLQFESGWYLCAKERVSDYKIGAGQRLQCVKRKLYVLTVSPFEAVKFSNKLTACASKLLYPGFKIYKFDVS